MTAAAGTTKAAAAFFLGNAGRNFCSQGTLVNTEAECRQAAHGKVFADTFSSSGWPKGCFVYYNGHYYFNTHSVGKGNSNARPVCQVGGRYIQHPPHAGAKQDTSLFTLSHLISPHLTLSYLILPHLANHETCRSSVNCPIHYRGVCRRWCYENSVG